MRQDQQTPTECQKAQLQVRAVLCCHAATNSGLTEPANTSHGGHLYPRVLHILTRDQDIEMYSGNRVSQRHNRKKTMLRVFPDVQETVRTLGSSHIDKTVWNVCAQTHTHIYTHTHTHTYTYTHTYTHTNTHTQTHTHTHTHIYTHTHIHTHKHTHIYTHIHTHTHTHTHSYS